MIYRFEILTEDDVYEGWAHTPEEMSEKFKADFPNVDHEVFPNRDKFDASCAPKMLTLSEFRAYRDSGMLGRAILKLDKQRYDEYLADFDEDGQFIGDAADAYS